MAVFVRRLVSTNKRRFEKDGYSLDLSYITPQIVAMGFPCDGVSSLYRNPMDQVRQLLVNRHADRFKVYNLCVERGYNPAVFGGRVVRLPMYDGQAPPLHLMLAVCRDAVSWLSASPDHVVVVHCKAGKGRTGAVVCALLIAMDPDLGPASFEAVLALWAQQRTKDGKGLTIPSQRRFLWYFHRVLLAAAEASQKPAWPPTAQPPPLARLTAHPAVAGGGGGPTTAASAGVKDVTRNPSQRPPTAETPAPDQGFSESTAGHGFEQPGGKGTHGNGAAPARLPLGGSGGSTCSAHGPGTAERDLLATSRGGGAAVLHEALRTAAVPTRAARLLRVRFRGLPMWLLRDCTASVWWRPSGHHEAYSVCHVHTGSGASGLTGCISGGASTCACQVGPAWTVRRSDSAPAAKGESEFGAGPGSSGAGIGHRGGNARSGPVGELELDLSTLPPLQPAPAPTPLPFEIPPLGQGPLSGSPEPPPPSLPPAGRLPTAVSASGSPEPHKTDLGVAAQTESGTCPETGSRSPGCPDPSAGSAPSGPLVAGDIKIQIFRGCLLDPPHDIFKGRVTQFSAWLNTAFLDPRVGSLDLGRKELDKLSKRLRRWRGPVGLTLEYEVAVS